jgi:hypothetical protein
MAEGTCDDISGLAEDVPRVMSSYLKSHPTVEKLTFVSHENPYDGCAVYYSGMYFQLSLSV